ncbi:MAG: cold shock domain-containing protein [Acidimicrobiaceae bacterium]|nr:cold shock domain-containing protein [Acidimicrobiaceae bacterium]
MNPTVSRTMGGFGGERGRYGRAADGVRAGCVVDFDEQVGLGTVESEDGRRWRFHCTQIADGTRTIAVGTLVTFEVVAGHRGAWEAVSVRPGS